MLRGVVMPWRKSALNGDDDTISCACVCWKKTRGQAASKDTQ